ncbi:MAG TPA: FtsX-like permease family protein, partial [Longimicrobiales bacterium]|nr:FtsX-like permease family protein [Longimicrobiales bacterium]
GVLPQSFDFSSTFAPGRSVDVLVPFPVGQETDRWGNTLALIGRLRPGVGVAAAQADLDRVNRHLQEADPARWGLEAVVAPLRAHISGSFRLPLMLLLAAAGAVLLVACANLSNLVLARSQARSRELALRSALGASRGRLARQLLVESVVLAAVGGGVGVLLAIIMTRALVGLGASQIPLIGSAGVDFGVMPFTLAVTLIAGVLVGLAPAFRLPRGGEAGRLRESNRGVTAGRGTAGVRNALVVAELALACVLIVGGGLLLRSFARVLDVELGFDPEGAYTWRVDSDRAFASRAAVVTYYDGLLEAVAALPGVDRVGLTDTPPFAQDRGWGIRVEGVRQDDQLPVTPRMIHSGYLQAMHIPLRAGRYFTPQDDQNSEPSMILNETAASALFPGEDPVGRIVLISAPQPRWRVVGVVADVRHRSPEAEAGLEMYLPLAQSPDYMGLTMVVRSRLPLATLAPGVRAALGRADPALPSGDFRAMNTVLERTLLPRRFILLVGGGFAAVTLLLAALGVYAVVSYSVSQRRPEFGVRLALGECPRTLRRRVVLGMLPTAALGIAIGAALSLAISRFLQALLYATEPTDPV